MNIAPDELGLALDSSRRAGLAPPQGAASLVAPPEIQMDIGGSEYSEVQDMRAKADHEAFLQSLSPRWQHQEPATATTGSSTRDALPTHLSWYKTCCGMSLALAPEIVACNHMRRLALMLLAVAFGALILQFTDLALLTRDWVKVHPTVVYLAGFSEALQAQILWLALRGVCRQSEGDKQVGGTFLAALPECCCPRTSYVCLHYYRRLMGLSASLSSYAMGTAIQRVVSVDEDGRSGHVVKAHLAMNALLVLLVLLGVFWCNELMALLRGKEPVAPRSFETDGQRTEMVPLIANVGRNV